MHKEIRSVTESLQGLSLGLTSAARRIKPDILDVEAAMVGDVKAAFCELRDVIDQRAMDKSVVEFAGGLSVEAEAAVQGWGTNEVVVQKEGSNVYKVMVGLSDVTAEAPDGVKAENAPEPPRPIEVVIEISPEADG